MQEEMLAEKEKNGAGEATADDNAKNAYPKQISGSANIDGSCFEDGEDEIMVEEMDGEEVLGRDYWTSIKVKYSLWDLPRYLILSRFFIEFIIIIWEKCDSINVWAK